MSDMKQCSKCKEIKSVSEFWKHRGHTDGLASNCKTCVYTTNRKWQKNNPEKCKKYGEKWIKNNPEKIKNNSLRQHHGITLEEFTQLFKHQNNSCKICGITEPPVKGWHVDHDHLTQHIRGILCHHCNVGIGHFKENITFLKNAINYLKPQVTLQHFSKKVV